MKKWCMRFALIALLLIFCGCSANSSCNMEEETQPTVPTLENLEYWDVVQNEIISMLHGHNLYVTATSHGYPTVQLYVEPGVVTEDGKIVASGLTQEEYEVVFNSVKNDLHMILDKYKIGKPKTIFHGCNSLLDIYFNNWFIDEHKIYDNVDSRRVASYGLDLLEYYYEYEENSYIEKDGFYADVWLEYSVYTP